MLTREVRDTQLGSSTRAPFARGRMKKSNPDPLRQILVVVFSRSPLASSRYE